MTVHRVIWVDDQGVTWRVVRVATGRWALSYYRPGAGWIFKSSHLDCNEALAAAHN
jgi:hypothetical protein